MSAERLDLEELEKIARAATPGTWGHQPEGAPGPMCWLVVAARNDLVADGCSPEDARHIATFDPPTVLSLLAQARRVEELERALKRVEGEAIEGANDLDDPYTATWDCSPENLPLIQRNVKRFGDIYEIARSALNPEPQP